ncbi:MAG: fused MFS/spermidine synthase [Myxococcota bacterium]
MTRILCTLFLLSGAAALLFETLWFRQAGLAFGNSVWASTLVLSGFMGGLALGNAGMVRFGSRIRRPIRFYALLEIGIAASGVALVHVLPSFGGWLAPLFRALLDEPWVLNPLRLALGLALLLVPATAMGATLPVLVKALSARDPNFGSVLGRLYGWNTLGAVVGALSGEAFLIEWFGVRGSALAAAACNLTAAAVALMLSARLRSGGEVAFAATPEACARRPLSRRAVRLLAAAFFAGAILLALEVVWFRFLHLFVHSGSLAFAMMLAVVLSGIALGGLAAGSWNRRDSEAARFTAPLALLAGAAASLCYAWFSAPLARFDNVLQADPVGVFGLSLALMFPVSLLSGVLFTFTGALLEQELRPETRAAGWLTLANTLGAAAGSGLAGFVLLPALGMEWSFLALSVAYAGVALLVRPSTAARRDAFTRRSGAVAAAALVLALLAFPIGKMETVYFLRSVDRWNFDGTAKVLAVREGRSETSIYISHSLDGQTFVHRLLTDGFAMSGTMDFARRYMKLYAYWPVAMHPGPRRALLISYGVGSTAKALVDTDELERIDVVDISRDILELSRIVYPDPAEHPLEDPRVHVTVEDGRFFLQTTDRRYDLITGEPPPPKNAGVVNLYTREYFQLVRDRLDEGGITTYWLPSHNLLESDAKAILRAFCDVFDDCSLWSGKGLDWMLVGSRNAAWHRDEARFDRQWNAPKLAPELRMTGFERPEQIGALFMADRDQLAALVGDTPPLTDDWPKRLGNGRHVPDEARVTYRDWMDPVANRARFEESAFIERAWPPELRRRTLAFFEVQRIIENAVARRNVGMPARMRQLVYLLRETDLVTAPLWHLGLTGNKLRAVEALVARGVPRERYRRYLARRAVARRDYDGALRVLPPLAPNARVSDVYFRATVLALAGRRDEALALEGRYRGALPRSDGDRAFWIWLEEIARPA